MVVTRTNRAAELELPVNGLTKKANELKCPGDALLYTPVPTLASLFCNE